LFRCRRGKLELKGPGITNVYSLHPVLRAGEAGKRLHSFFFPQSGHFLRPKCIKVYQSQDSGQSFFHQKQYSIKPFFSAQVSFIPGDKGLIRLYTYAYLTK
jgi:hypothetical protein